MAAAAPALLDTRGEVRSKTFSGKDDEWVEWCMKFEGYCSLLGWDDFMDQAARHPVVIPNADVGPSALRVSRQLYGLLINKCEGKALSIIRICERHAGLDAWRRLKGEYEAPVGGRFAAMLRGILHPVRDWQTVHEAGCDF